MHPISQINWALKEHKNRLADVDSQQRRLGYKRLVGRKSEAKTGTAMQILTSFSGRVLQFLQTLVGTSDVGTINGSHQESRISQ